MQVTCAIVSHNRIDQLNNMIWQIENQIEPFDEIKIYVSGYDPKDLKHIKYPISFQPDKKDWGHDKRALAIKECETEYIVTASDDDIYPYHFLKNFKKFLETEPDGDIYACDFRTQREENIPSHHASPVLGGVTSGSMMIKAAFVNEHDCYKQRDFGADGMLAKTVMEAGGKFVRVSELLFFHY